MELKVKKFVENAKLPVRVREGDAGIDLYCLDGFEIEPNEIKVISTGIAVEIPKGYVGIIKDRSGLAVQGIHILGGVIDENYRGEIKIVLINLGKSKLTFEKNSRIAQLLILPYLKCEIKEVSDLSISNRGEMGFGSSGTK